MALVHLEHVTKRFGADRPPATDGLSFTVESGRILALLGPSGCGKTTTLRLIAGFETPDQGRIAIAGQTVADADRGIHVEPEARGVGVVFQDSRSSPTSPSRRTSASGPDAAGEAVNVRRYFRGPENLYCLDLSSGHRVHSSQPSSAAFPNGLRVRPEAHVLHVVTFPATS